MDHSRISAKTIKLEENLGESLCDLELGKDLLTSIQKPSRPKRKMDFTKIEKFCSLKTLLKTQKRPLLGGNICKIHLIKCFLQNMYIKNDIYFSNKISNYI